MYFTRRIGRNDNIPFYLVVVLFPAALCFSVRSTVRDICIVKGFYREVGSKDDVFECYFFLRWSNTSQSFEAEGEKVP